MTRARAFELAYNLDHAEAAAFLRAQAAARPDDPALQRSLAAIIWLEILFRRGAVTVDHYLGGIVRTRIEMARPPADLAAAFRQHAERAVALAERRVATAPRDAEAHYELGAALGLLASYTATVEGSTRGALSPARRAYRAHEQVLRLAPHRKDAGFVVGLYRYVVSLLPAPVRAMAYLVGFGSGRDRGLRMIEEAAAYAGDAESEALFALVLLYNRERRFDDALGVLGRLQRRYPRNRLLWLEAGATALRAGRAADAEVALTEGMVRLERDERPRFPGEEALWRYKRGAARVALRRPDEARADLRAALAVEGPPWVRGRVHLELGKLADLAGDRPQARVEYRRAAALCDAGNDPAAANEARQLTSRPYAPRR